MEPAKPPTASWLRRIFQPKFSLRTLVLGIAVLGVGLGMFNRLDHQRQLVAKIEAAGGICEYEGGADNWLREWLPRSYFDAVRLVRFYNNSKSIDEALPFVAELKALKELDLENRQISDAGLAHLAELKSLKSIELNDTQVGDAGLPHFAGMKSLRWLGLENTQVSDKGLVHLRGLKSLGRLCLEDTQVSEAGVEELRTFLPDCQISGP